ncbi:MAG: 2-succinyl-5-enolpyruvyl-6-hydroxy-3-cyclohexene-1-carboxylic-acid synthase [Myxococcaceae bacterium]
MASLNTLWARAVVQELVRAGVRHAVVSPGSRSAPLALACAEAAPGLSVTSVVDERTAGFFALGMALQTGLPSAVVVTSGTAGAHLLPAVMEAWAARVPLVVLTANRPWELHGFGAPQTVPQEGLFGRFARTAVALSAPEASSTALVHLRAVVSRTVASCQTSPCGPVHLDVPFREPLVPGPGAPDVVGLEALAWEGREGAFLDAPAPARKPPEAALAELRRRLTATEKGLVVVGPRAARDGLAPAVVALATSYGYPVVADAASNVRWRGAGRVVGHADVLLRSEALRAALRPDVVLRLGGGLTSKRLGQWLDESGATTVLLTEDDNPVDAAHRASLLLAGDLASTCAALTASAAPGRAAWAETVYAADARADALLSEAFTTAGPFSEPQLAHRLLSCLPEGACLMVASSMPIRDVDAFAPAQAARLRVLANRGVNGIDGTLSTALGVAATSAAPTVVLLGDLAFLHDLGGLLIARRSRIPLTVVVANNDGGGIFSFLPVAGVGASFEPLFATPHGLELAHAGALFGAQHVQVQSAAELSAAVRAGLQGGLHLVEAKLPSRAANVALHQELGERAARAAEQAL